MDRRNFTIPFAIIVAGILIGGAMMFSGNQKTNPATVLESLDEPSQEGLLVPPISEDDHILGSPNAPIVLIEYSDTECPFCKQFHATMHRIINEYGKDGQVAWVYRHFPLAQIHDKAPKEAEASECAAELGGNSAFWTYVDKVYAITPSNNGLDQNLLPQIAEDMGLDRSDFEQCLKSGRHEQKVVDHFNQAVNGGGTGTPFTVLMFGNSAVPLEGAQPYAAIKAVLDQIFTEAGKQNSQEEE